MYGFGRKVSNLINDRQREHATAQTPTNVRMGTAATLVLVASRPMDTNTVIIIVVLVLLLGGGGFFLRGRR